MKKAKLVDDLIDCMDLSKKRKGKVDDDDDEEEEELYDPHLTFNPYIQRMFQSIALRATNPTSELPDFDKHMTSAYLAKIGARVCGSDVTKDILKRMAEEFPTRSFEKKLKASDDAAANIFEKKKSTDENKENEADVKADLNGGLDQLLDSSTSLNKTKTIGITYVY